MQLPDSTPSFSRPSSTREVEARARLCFALDVASLDEARAWVTRLAPHVGVFKVGLELFLREGRAAVSLVHDAGAQCFLDLKLHDIPNTVAGAVTSVRSLGVAYLTVHASGGAAMLRRAVECAGEGTTILAVTALTSLDDDDVRALGFDGGAGAWALRLGGLAMGAGVPGLVCSPHEASALRAAYPKAVLVTPGVRPAGSEKGDQARAATPADAMRAGANVLVVGRPLREAISPERAAEAMVREMAEALS